jgi:MFS transporter, DHA1 family, inner membrane transport protein
MDLRLLWLALGGFAMAAEGFVIGSLLPAIAAETGVTIPQAGYLVFAGALAAAIGAPILAAIFGGGDRRLILTVSSLIFALCALFVALAPDYPLVMLARTALTLGGALYIPIAQAAAVAMSPPEKRGRAIAIVVLGMSVAVALGAPLGAWIAYAWGWRWTYLLIAGLSAVAGLMVWLNIPSGSGDGSTAPRQRLAVVAAPGVLPALLTTALFMLGGFTALVYVAPLTTDAMGFDASFIPIVLLVYGLCAVVGNWLGGQLADRLGALHATLLFTVGQIVCLALFSVVPLLPSSVIAPLYLVQIGAFAIVGWGFYVAQISRMGALAGDSAPLAMSLFATAVTLGNGFAALAGGAVLESMGVLSIGWVAALLPAVSLLLLLAEWGRGLRAVPRRA